MLTLVQRLARSAKNEGHDMMKDLYVNPLGACVDQAEVHASSPDFSQGCPQCGGLAFRAVRSSGVRAAKTVTALSFPITGPFALLAFAGRKNRAECITCGTRFSR